MRCAARWNWIQKFPEPVAALCERRCHRRGQSNSSAFTDRRYSRRASYPDVNKALLNPQRAIERAILDCFADVFGSDVALAIEVGNRARDFQDAIVTAGA